MKDFLEHYKTYGTILLLGAIFTTAGGCTAAHDAIDAANENQSSTPAATQHSKASDQLNDKFDGDEEEMDFSDAYYREYASNVANMKAAHQYQRMLLISDDDEADEDFSYIGGAESASTTYPGI